jgi:hypothetical protein
MLGAAGLLTYCYKWEKPKLVFLPTEKVQKQKEGQWNGSSGKAPA